MLLAAFMAVTSVGWVHAQENATQSANGKLTAEDVGTGNDLRKYVYANGNPITITAKGEKGVTIKSGEEDILEYENGAIVILFGGKKNTSVETSTITMESGILRNLYGGGYGELSQNGGEKSADVKGSTTITIKGGTIDNILAAGGLYYAKSKDVVIEVSGNASVAYPFMGGVESGSTKKNTIETTYENSVNSVESTKFSMTGGKVTGYIGCGGGQGYSYSKKTEVTLDGVEIPTLYGIASNGRSDKVTVKAIRCKIVTEFSAINRGRVGVLDMIFDGCEFGDKVEGFLGATEGWANSDTKTTEIPQVLESVSCTIVNTKKGAPIVRIGQGLDAANVNLIGAKAYNKPFKDKTTGTGGTTFNSFNIGKDKVWNFYNGLLTEDATLTLDQTAGHKAVLNNMFFADGKAITIEVRGESKEGVKIGNEEYDETLQVYGGSYKKDINESTSITMTGGTVKNLFGGGYGSNKNENDNLSADVKDVSIKITGGTVSNLLEGGGKYKSKSENVVIDISGADTKIATLYAGGYDAGLTTNTLETPLAESVNGVQTVKLTMTGGEITEGIGCGGGQGYTRTGKSTVTLTNVKIAAFYGVLANGRADDIEATVTNCTFAKNGDYYEFASVNRGTVENITCTFDGCTFNNLDNINACLGPVNGWADSDTDGKIIPCVTGKAIFKFVNSKTATPVMQIGQGLESADIELIGAKAKVTTFKKNESTTISTFELGTGKTWSLNEGLTVSADATLTNNGTLNVAKENIMDAIAVGGTLMADSAMATTADVLTEMNKASDKKELKNNNFSIECKDGVIASNETVAKELLKAGKVVMVLSFSENTYSIASFQKTLAKITNLPDSVVFGTAPITLAFNLPGTEVSINGNTSEVVELKDGVLTIKKPGTVTFNLKVVKDTNGDGIIDDKDKKDGNFEYDEDAANTQILKVTKRKVTLTEGLAATEKTYDGNTSITLTKSTLVFSGKLGTDATGLDLAANPTGKLTDANAGENKEVIVTAALAAGNSYDSTAYYELAPITFVKAKVTPKAATVTATAASRDYGVENPEFTATTTGLVTDDKLDGILKFTCTATKDSLAKTYDIVPYGLTSDNYTITFTKGTLTVNAVNPVIEMVEAKTVLKSDNSAKEIQLKAKLIHAGGANKITSVKFVQGNTDVTATLGTDGFYTGKFDVSAGTTYSVKASATAGSNTGDSKAISIVVDALTPQVVSFGASVLPTMVYGNEMTLSAMSDQTAATGDYTYSVAEGDPATIADGKLKATKVGKVTLTVSRAADVAHSAAVATQTIEIMPKPITVTVGVIEKVYDGTAAIKTLPTFTLTGASDDVSVKTEGLTLSFASKNAGESVKVLMPELTLTGDNAANYILIQPKNVTGKITKAPLTVTVKDVTRMWNQRYTKYEFEATGLVNDETLSNVYSGVFNVTEDGSVLNLNMPGACPNYAITTVPGTLTINKGTPVAVVYGSSSNIQAMVVDSAGYGKDELTLNAPAEGTGFATISAGGTTFRSFNEISVTPAVTTYSMPQTKAAGDWDDTRFGSQTYGTSFNVAKEDNFTYMSTNTNVLTLKIDGSDVVCTPVGTGKATIVAVGAASTKIKNIEVKPVTLTVTTSDMKKTYDGTTLASGTLTLSNEANGKDVALDLSGITFNFADKAAGDNKTITPSQSLILIGSEANNYALEGTLTGNIEQKEVTVGTPLSAYYNGKNVMELTDYTSNDRISGDIVPIKVTFGAATVGEQTVTLAMGTTGDAKNYKLASMSQPEKGNILKSTVVAELPATASSASNLKSNIKLTIRETGETITSSAIAFNPTVTSEGSGSNTVYYVNGGETDNYSVVYDKNQLGYKAAPTPPAGGGDEGDETVTISLDATTKTLPRTEEFVLKATVSPSDKTVTWSSSDPTIASVTANGNSATVKALKVGTATITAKIGDVTATCEVTVDFATGLEEALANTQVYAKQGSIYVNPIQPLQLTIVNMLGKTVYNARISSYAQIPVTNGIYIVKLTNAGNTIVTKVNVY